jgi:hypothetical protein
MKPKILTANGTYFDLLEPENNIIDIEVIAHALSNICRFTGHTVDFYSVAQHSVHASFLVPPEHAMAALMHDAAEAYIGDIATPLKRLLPDYALIEMKVEAAVFDHFEIPFPFDACVKRADLVMLATEDRDLLPSHFDKWFEGTDIEPMTDHIICWTPHEAQMKFLARFDELDARRTKP